MDVIGEDNNPRVKDDVNPTIKITEDGSILSSTEQADTFDDAKPGTSAGQQRHSLKTVTNMATSLKKWKIRTREVKTEETIAKDHTHQLAMDKIHERFQTSIPHPLLIVVKKEALSITHRTAGVYKSMLGSKHRLTQEAVEHITYLKKELGLD